MQLYCDLLQKSIDFVDTPSRIVSLVPSQTELLYDLGLGDRVVGITKFCVHPHEWFVQKKRVGGTKNVHLDWVADLHPDLIIANKEENVEAHVRALSTLASTYVSDVNNLQEALNMITTIGALTNTPAIAHEMHAQIVAAFATLDKLSTPLKIAYLIWHNPYMTVGNQTFIHAMLETIGCENVFAHKERYPTIRLEDLQAAAPDIVLFSSEPYPFKESHLSSLQASLPNAKMLLVDGEMFSWYGSRLRYAAKYFRELQAQLII